MKQAAPPSDSLVHSTTQPNGAKRLHRRTRTERATIAIWTDRLSIGPVPVLPVGSAPIGSR